MRINTNKNNFLHKAYVKNVTGRYDTTQLVLEWEFETPVTATLGDHSWVPYLTEYKLLKIIPHSSEHYVEPVSVELNSSQYLYK